MNPTQSNWHRVIWTGVGGVLAVGVPDERRIVVGSHAGVGVFDATTGERVYRSRDNDYTWWDQERLSIILNVSGGESEVIPSMGLEGGSLPAVTADGWTCSQCESGAVLTRGDETVEVVDPEEARAVGFSPAGSLFVFATSPSLTVLRRVVDV